MTLDEHIKIRAKRFIKLLSSFEEVDGTGPKSEHWRQIVAQDATVLTALLLLEAQR